MDRIKEEKEKIIEQMLMAIGEDTKREGLIDTPKRVVKMWNEIFRGYDKEQLPKVTTFKNGSDGIIYDQMIHDDGPFYSMCEHHMMPFIGSYFFAVIPHKEGKLLGLSKVARVVDYFSAKLQIQERLGHDIVKHLWKELCIEVPNDVGDAVGVIEVREPLAMGLVLEAEHLCKTMRGAKKKGKMRTTILKGTFKTDPSARAEFFGWVNNNRR